jgi:hypothetical protein
MKRLSALIFALGTMFAGTTAHAASFTATLASFKLDDTTKGPTGAAGEDRLLLFFTSNVNICPNTLANGPNGLVFNRSYSPASFDNWVKTVTAALLAGKTLLIDTYAPNGNNASNCQVRAIGITN